MKKFGGAMIVCLSLLCAGQVFADDEAELAETRALLDARAQEFAWAQAILATYTESARVLDVQAIKLTAASQRITAQAMELTNRGELAAAWKLVNDHKQELAEAAELFKAQESKFTLAWETRGSELDRAKEIIKARQQELVEAMEYYQYR